MSKKQQVVQSALQYSKRLSRFICWIWALYRIGLLVAATMEPESASAIASTLGGIDTIMMFNLGTYLCNSLGEKIIYSDRFVLNWLSKAGFNSLIGKAVKSVSRETDEAETEFETEDIEYDISESESDEPNG